MGSNLKLLVTRFGIGIGITALAVVGLTTGYLLHDRQAEQPASIAQAPGAAAVTPTPLAMPLAASEPTPLPHKSSASSRPENPLELSHDLRAVYDRYKSSSDAAERYTAYRAWSACFPNFVAVDGQLASLEALTHAIPDNGSQRAARVDAYRNLQARCRSFSAMSQKEIQDATRSQQEANNLGILISPGEMAEKYLNDGNKDAALKTMRAIVGSRDPFAIASLRESVNQLIVLRVDAQTVHSDERPDLRSLAFSLAACQLGLECGAASLTALQLCMSMAQCSGSVADRYQDALPNQADRDALVVETRRVLEAIRSGNFEALGLE